jgi:hypothetical protein
LTSPPRCRCWRPAAPAEFFVDALFLLNPGPWPNGDGRENDKFDLENVDPAEIIWKRTSKSTFCSLKKRRI